MSDEEINMAIAKACGWVEAFPEGKEPHPETRRGGILLPYTWVNTNTHERRSDLPNYCGDLNAMHSAEKAGALDQLHGHYARMLGELILGVASPIQWVAVCATAHQRAESFLKTIGKWNDAYE